MLSYAWDKLEESDRICVDLDGITTLPDLFARILTNALYVLFKRGLDRSYVESTEEVSGIKGKLELSQTLKVAAHLRQKTICSYDELSYNTLPNQILYSTLHNLVNTENLNLGLKSQLRRCIKSLIGIEGIKLNSRHFSFVNAQRNNKFYKFILNVCQLVHENSLPSERQGKWEFMDFTRNERKMSLLFQSFVLRFYTIKYEETYRVGSKQIKWQFDGNAESISLAPLMITDICLENSSSKVIIDTKFYNEAMSTHYNKEKIKSINLYQLFAYLLNQETGDPKTLSCKGILLYPTTEKEYNLQFKYKDHAIEIRTVDLNDDWNRVEKRLESIVGD